jgi:DNA-binding transcriptional ArsR family regulator
MTDGSSIGAPVTDRLASSLAALAHPVRLRIVEALAVRGSCVCGDLVELFPLAQATVSQHLKVLKDAGLVRGTVVGRNRCYCLDPEGWRALAERFDRLVRTACCPTGQRQEDAA